MMPGPGDPARPPGDGPALAVAGPTMTRAYAGWVSSDPRPRSGHVCLAFDSRAELESHARDFLREGAAAGEMTWFVAVEAPTLALPFEPLGDAYPDGTVIDPAAQVAAYAAATERALAAGYSGLRVVADATPLVRMPVQLDAFVRYEYRIDRYMHDHPFRAVCAYDRVALGDHVIAQLACMHDTANVAVPFRLRAGPADEGGAVLDGELDPVTAELFTTALDRADLTPVGDEVVLRATGLRFADHGSLLRLQEYADRHATTVVLRGAGRGTARLAGLLDLPRLRVEVLR